MVYNYNGNEIYYEYLRKGSSRPIILLHGWGRSGEDFSDLISFLPNKSFLVLDFPPFGKSEKDIQGWNIYTYVGMLMSLCEHLKIYSADILGHSFGGRIALILSAVKRSLVHSCILVDSAGMKPRRSIRYRYKLVKYKLAKKFRLASSQKGSPDYQNLSPQMKETFKSIVNTHLEDYARKMSVKTLIVWGAQDDQTPIYMAKRLHKLVKNSKLEILEAGGHFSFIDCKLKFYSILSDFLKEE